MCVEPTIHKEILDPPMWSGRTRFAIKDLTAVRSAHLTGAMLSIHSPDCCAAHQTVDHIKHHYPDVTTARNMAQ